MNPEWPSVYAHILQLEQQGLVTRTFRRLDPARQQAVITAILAEAGEKGPAAINIKQVAKRAGVSIGSLYQYFYNRDRLLAFATELCVRLVRDAFDQYRTVLAAMPLREALAAYVMGGLEWGQTQTGLIQFFARAAYQGDSTLTERIVLPIANVMREIVQDILTQAARRGEVAPNVDIEAAARVINTLLIAVGDSQLLPHLNAYYQLSDAGMPYARVLEAALDLILRGAGLPQTPYAIGNTRHVQHCS